MFLRANYKQNRGRLTRYFVTCACQIENRAHSLSRTSRTITIIRHKWNVIAKPLAKWFRFNYTARDRFERLLGGGELGTFSKINNKK